ncbi:MAG: hypothetical protein U5R06_02640 [candidate division KSB1 bacterium]|nr:hypothetical protein [candidate division KSB1 bacterium]
MMKRTAFLMLLALLYFVNPCTGMDRTAGIGFRGTFWNMDNSANSVSISNRPGYQAEYDLGGGGGYLFMFSRLNENMFLELTLGAVGKLESHQQYGWGEEVDVNAVTPLLLGFRTDLLPFDSRSALQPYAAAGMGPYWFSDVYVRDDYMIPEEQVDVRTKARLGGYAGGGINFMFTDWMGFNFDVKYHFIDFNKKHEYSGYEYGMGIIFTWGRTGYRDHDRKINIHIE